MRVGVVGGGIAGCSAAYAFARRNARVTLVEREPRVAMAASGNAAGLAIPWMARVPDARTSLCLRGFAITRELVATMELEGVREGVLRFANTDRLRHLHADLKRSPIDLARAVDAREASEIAGVEVEGDALWFPTALSLSPPALCEAMIAAQRERIDVRTRTEALAFERVGSTWVLRGADGEAIAEAEVLVLAAANDCARFAPTAWLPLEPVRGQVVHLEGDPVLERLKVALCSDGYVARAPKGGFVVGSSFEHGNESIEVRQETQLEILRSLQRMVPSFRFDESREYAGRVAFRCSATNHMPIVGAVPNAEEFAKGFRAQSYRSVDIGWKEPWWVSGLYVSTAHGSHGLVTAPWAGEFIAATEFGEEIDGMIEKATSPLRFVVAKLNRVTGSGSGPRSSSRTR